MKLGSAWYNVEPGEGTPLAPEDPIAEGIVVIVGPEDNKENQPKN